MTDAAPEFVQIAWRRTSAADPRWAARASGLDLSHLALGPVGAHAQELLCLCTCERQEIYFVPRTSTADLLPALDDALQVLGAAPAARRVRRGLDAARHLLRVAAGLDSRILGEPHVTGQVRTALRAAETHGLAGDVIDRLGRRAMRAARTVRTHTPIGRLGHSYATVAADLVTGALADHHDPRIGVIGSGALAGDVANALRERGAGSTAIYARHPKPQSVPVRHLDTLAGDLADLDAVIAATSAASPLLTDVHHVRLGHRPLLAVDLGVPANIAPAFGDDARVTRIDVDDLDPAGDVESAALRAADALIERQLRRLAEEWSALAGHSPALLREAG